jgi:hypothetical protein
MALSVLILIVVLYVLVPLSNDNRCPECGGMTRRSESLTCRCRIGDGGAVISGAAGDHAGEFAVRLFLAHVNSMIGAAHFERTCGAFALQFEKDLAIPLRG